MSQMQSNSPGAVFSRVYAIRSHHSKIEPSEMVEALEGEIGDLAAHLERDKQYGPVSVSTAQRGTLPIDPHIVYVAIKITGEALASGIFEKLGGDVYEWLKSRLKDATVTEERQEKN